MTNNTSVKRQPTNSVANYKKNFMELNKLECVQRTFKFPPKIKKRRDLFIHQTLTKIA